MRRRRRRVDWPGLSVFVLSLAVGIVLVVGIVALVADRGHEPSLVALHGLTALLGAVVGAISTYLGYVASREDLPGARHVRTPRGVDGLFDDDDGRGA